MENQGSIVGLGHVSNLGANTTQPLVSWHLLDTIVCMDLKSQEFMVKWVPSKDIKEVGGAGHKVEL